MEIRFQKVTKIFLKKSLTYRFCTRETSCSFWGGGGVAALTFLCKTSWKNSILFLKAFAEYKKNNLIETSVYTFVIPYQFHTFILSRLACIETLKFQEKIVLKKKR